jgi:hypothetical protein
MVLISTVAFRSILRHAERFQASTKTASQARFMTALDLRR